MPSFFNNLIIFISNLSTYFVWPLRFVVVAVIDFSVALWFVADMAVAVNVLDRHFYFRCISDENNSWQREEETCVKCEFNGACVRVSHRSRKSFGDTNTLMSYSAIVRRIYHRFYYFAGTVR